MTCNIGRTIRAYPLLATLLGLKADSGQYEFDFDLDLDDAEIVATYTSVYASAIEQARLAEVKGQPLSAADLTALKDAADAVAVDGLKLLSKGAESTLQSYLGQIKGLLGEMAGGGLNPIQAAARMQETLAAVEAAGGGVLTEQYSPYQWSRLARTEAKFAQTAAERAEHVRDGVRTEAIDELGAAPALHPHCSCVTGVIEVSGELWEMLHPAPTACEYCVDIATQVMDYIEGAAGSTADATVIDDGE